MTDRPGPRVTRQVIAVDGRVSRRRTDQLATEEPMEIRVTAGGHRHTLSITMRTPGADFELAAGFLLAEGVVRGRPDIRTIRYCTDPDVDGDQRYNVVTVDLAPGVTVDLDRLERHTVTSSACGVCGKGALEAIHLQGCAPLPDGPAVGVDVLHRLPGELRARQGVFDRTGGLHAAALFDAGGSAMATREDVGRHNAVDKVVGWAVLHGMTPLSDRLLMVSGRAGFEIVQKAITAGIPVVCSVSAPSSLAVDLAREFGVTLVGFLREGRFNVYAGDERLDQGSELRAPG